MHRLTPTAHSLGYPAGIWVLLIYKLPVLHSTCASTSGGAFLDGFGAGLTAVGHIGTLYIKCSHMRSA